MLRLATLIPLSLLVPTPVQARTWTGEAALHAMPGGPTSSVGLSVESRHTFLALEGRGATDGVWAGRATAGLDVFGGDNLDLTLGWFLGGWGDASMHGIPTGGFELGLGVAFGDLGLRYRHIRGGADLGGSCTCDRGELCTFHENDWRVSYQVLRDMALFAQITNLNPQVDEDHRQTGVGVGAQLGF